MASVVEIESPAKINLWLRILGRRQDGFHEIETRLCKLSLGDKVVVELLATGQGMELSCTDPTIPTDASNLAIRALQLFEQRLGVGYSWRIHLEKHIPAGAGLGGGSSNAAAVLTAANQLLGSPLPSEDLLKIGASIGSDVPCFLLEACTLDGKGRGERVSPVEASLKLPLVLAKPPFPVSTPWAYKQWQSSREIPGIAYGTQSTPWGMMQNDLERPVFEKFMLLPSLKMWLLRQQGVRAVLMSGSGSTMFAVTDTASVAENLAEELRSWCGSTSWVTATTTL